MHEKIAAVRVLVCGDAFDKVEDMRSLSKPSVRKTIFSFCDQVIIVLVRSTLTVQMSTTLDTCILLGSWWFLKRCSPL